jgi:hypothetical protein
VTAPFAPAFRDGQTGADIIAALVQDKPYGTVLSFGDLAEALGVSDGDLVTIRGAVNRSKRRLNRDHMRHLVTVPTKGYKVIPPGEFAAAATSHRKKSDRQIKKGISIIKAADERDMSEAELTRHRQMGSVLQSLHERQKDTDNRLARIENLLFSNASPKVIPGEVEAPPAIEAPAGGATSSES